MGVKNIVKKIGNYAGNKVAKLSVLSSDQVDDIQAKREAYLLEMPKADDAAALDITWRMLAASSVEIFSSYLPQIKDLYLPVQKDAEYAEAFRPGNNIRYFNITKWVTEKKENSLEKLVNVYAVLSNENCNIALVFNRTQSGTNVYLAVVNTENADNNTDAKILRKRLAEAVRGNFPGAEINTNDSKNGEGILPCLDNDRSFSVAAASNIPTEKSEKFISQTIEKLLDGIVPDTKKQEYTIILLATPITDIEARKTKLSEFYSGMKPYSEWETNFTYTENSSQGSSATVGINVGASAGVQSGNSNSMTNMGACTENEGQTTTDSTSDSLSSGSSVSDSESTSHTDGSNSSETRSLSNTHTDSSNTSHTYTSGDSDSAGGGAQVGGNFVVGASATYNHSWNTSTADASGSGVADAVAKSTAKTIGKLASDTITKGITNTLSQTTSQTVGSAVANTLGKAVTKSMALTSGLSKAVNFGLNAGANFARSSTVTAMIGKNEGITQHFMNYGIKHAMEMLESQMKRYEQSTALGMWDFAAYVLSEDSDIAGNVAHSYLALTLGEESYMSKSAINLWKGDVNDNEKDVAREIVGYLRELRHPIFALNSDYLIEDKAYNVYPPIVTATTPLSGKELAYSLNFPQRSILGLPVIECAEFGRSIATYDPIDINENALELGSIFHMNHVEQNAKVTLGKKSLASHVFVTGSTGSGKSNTVYQLLSKACEKDVRFLVVEPAKGEYKNCFGRRKDVFVYGTNPMLTPMLRINPFSFPRGIHILEHLDRLVEIFNVCWPMYAAMPAVLKDAVEKAYLDCGWDMVRSVNKYGETLYPTFADVARNIKEIIDSSEFDNENKGAYKGSLLTRLKSLTNGLNGIIFTCDELSAADLFDRNVIVDLSRVGSTETKSLIMGMLVLKLQEYRMTSGAVNAELTHLTVLEEAHNLLKRTSTEQVSESSNLVGKSVEMLANAISEMRTYGEGFVIVDQAPGLLDMSVIRNTNTKIIMRLPDLSDRELVGRAANLNDDQINELARLPCGVAAVFQNEWIQPVLCKVNKFKCSEKMFEYTPDEDNFDADSAKLSESLLEYIMNDELFRRRRNSYLIGLKHRIVCSKLDSAVKRDFIEYINSDDSNSFEHLRALVYDFLSAEKAIKASESCSELGEWTRSVVDKLAPSIKRYTSKQIDLVLALILYEQVQRDAAYNELFCSFTEIYNSKGEVF